MPGIKYTKHELPRCRQGDVFRDVDVVDAVDVDAPLEDGQTRDEEDGAEGDLPGTLTERHIPYCVVLSQDCDLEHDFNNRAKADRKNDDKFLPALLVAPAYLAAVFKDGDHLKELSLKMTAFKGNDWDRVQRNHLYRYHFLQSSPHELQFPELYVAFKNYLTVPSETFNREFKQTYKAIIN